MTCLRFAAICSILHLVLHHSECCGQDCSVELGCNAEGRCQTTAQVCELVSHHGQSCRCPELEARRFQIAKFASDAEADATHGMHKANMQS